MTTTITREERERVAKLLSLNLDGMMISEIGRGVTTDVRLYRDDIDRVAQALRDAEADGRLQGMQAVVPQWREVTETEPALHTRVVAWACRPAESELVPPQVASRTPRYGFVDETGSSFSAPTHWMPLPPPPEKKPDHSKRIAELEAEIARLKAEQ